MNIDCFEPFKFFNGGKDGSKVGVGLEDGIKDGEWRLEMVGAEEWIWNGLLKDGGNDKVADECVIVSDGTNEDGSVIGIVEEYDCSRLAFASSIGNEDSSLFGFDSSLDVSVGFDFVCGGSLDSVGAWEGSEGAIFFWRGTKKCISVEGLVLYVRHSGRIYGGL